MEHSVMKHKRTTFERAEKFVSSMYFKDINLHGRLYPKVQPVDSISHYAAPDRITVDNAMKQIYQPCSIGQSFGPSWSTHWFRVELKIPKSWVEHEVYFLWNSDSEAMIWYDGQPVQGLSSQHERCEYLLSEKASLRHLSFTLYVEMACNGLFGVGRDGLINPPDSNRSFVLSKAEIAIRDPLVFQLLRDFDILIGMAKHLPENSERCFQALYTANSMVNECLAHTTIAYQRAREIAKDFFSKKNGSMAHEIHAMGHCHIDSAWLWPYAETIRKCARSWSSTLRLMDKFPHFTFVCSQAQQFEWVKSHYPSLYERIKKSVRNGHFIPVGGCWVEMDGNIPSGESFFRQFLYGQSFFEKEFGITCSEFWLPDTFGYSSQLPQIMKLCGIDKFVTQKLSWNLVNKFPHHTFWWEGIDNTCILTHFPPGDSYEMTGSVEEVLKTVNNFQEKGRSSKSMFLFGHGDGGNGPDEAMLERLDRMKNIDGLPKVVMSTPTDFFQAVESEDTSMLCKWKGELYLELHNGTYTTHAKVKKYNRTCEFLLTNVEIICSIAFALQRNQSAKFKYPEEEIRHLWKLLLLNQFHDVLPGTSINMVYRDAYKHYSEIRQLAGNQLYDGITSIVTQQDANENCCIVFNTLSWDRIEVVQIPEDGPETSVSKKTKLSSEISQIDCCGKQLVLVSSPSCGYSVLKPLTLGEISFANKEDDLIYMKNDCIRVTLDSCGRIVSLKSVKTNMECISPNCLGNQFLLFDDVPLYWDAWDVMDYHLETRKPLETFLQQAMIVDSGPLRSTVKVSLKISESSYIIQHIMLDVGCPYLKFKTEVTWYECHKFLKVEFPFNLTTTKATYDIQYGWLERPTHSNTSWDWARFEVCGHKWADLSQYGLGVAVLNDSKYGYSAFENVLRLSLLRSSKSPDPKADMGIQHFTYAVMPHSGCFQKSGLIQQAYNLNSPLIVKQLKATVSQNECSFFKLNTPQVVLSAVKKSEKCDKALVLRLYESFGGHVSAQISVDKFLIEKAFACNGLECIEEFEEKKCVRLVNDHSIEADFRPFQIISILVYLA